MDLSNQVTKGGPESQKGPQMKILNLGKYKMEFQMTETDIGLANALRRIMISEVPTLAIEIVEVRENTSALHDEFLCHRLGLIPLDSKQVDNFKYSEECPCSSSCQKCTVQYNLKQANREREDLEFTSRDLALAETGEEREPIMPCIYLNNRGHEDPILIGKLSKNQQVDFQLYAKKGIGQTHAKWSPVSTCVMRKLPYVKVEQEIANSQMSVQQRKKLVESCPRKVFRFNEARSTVDIEDADRCTLCKECTKCSVEMGFPTKTVEYGEDPCSFLFQVESTGVLEPEDILLKAMRILHEKLSNFSHAITASEPIRA